MLRISSTIFLCALAALSLHITSCTRRDAPVAEDPATKEAALSIPASFSASFSMESASGAMEGRMFVDGDRTRMELPQSTIITRLDKGVSWILMPAGMYIEQPATPENAAGIIGADDESVERELLGEETLRGVRVNKYRVAAKGAQGRTSFYQWVDKKSMMPLKVAGEGGLWSVEYMDVKPGGQDPSMFELPAGYRKMEIPASR